MEHRWINNSDLPREIESYEVILLADISRLSEKACSLLDIYIENGGKLWFTGLTSAKDEIGNPLDQIRLKSLGVNPEYKSLITIRISSQMYPPGRNFTSKKQQE